MQQYFRNLGAEEQLTFEVEFDKSAISLNIPLTGVSVHEWSLISLAQSGVSLKYIKLFVYTASLSCTDRYRREE